MVDKVEMLWQRIDAVRILRGQTQQRCIDDLVENYGAPRRSQSSMSRYLHGRQEPPSEVASAMRRYLSDASEVDGGTTGDITGAFAAVVQDVTGEPILGPRQGALLDAITTRIAAGPPMSASDLEAYGVAARDLRLTLGDHPDHGQTMGSAKS
jgi:hypothetical protein